MPGYVGILPHQFQERVVYFLCNFPIIFWQEICKEGLHPLPICSFEKALNQRKIIYLRDNLATVLSQTGQDKTLSQYLLTLK